MREQDTAYASDLVLVLVRRDLMEAYDAVAPGAPINLVNADGRRLEAPIRQADSNLPSQLVLGE